MPKIAETARTNRGEVSAGRVLVATAEPSSDPSDGQHYGGVFCPGPLFLALADALPIFVWVIKDEGEVVWASPRVRDTLGSDPMVWAQWLQAPEAADRDIGVVAWVERELMGVSRHWIRHQVNLPGEAGQAWGRVVVYWDGSVLRKRELDLLDALQCKANIINELLGKISRPVISMVEREQKLATRVREKVQHILKLSDALQSSVNSVEHARGDLQGIFDAIGQGVSTPRTVGRNHPARFSITAEQLQHTLDRLGQQSAALAGCRSFLDQISLYERLDDELMPPNACPVMPARVVAGVVEQARADYSIERIEWNCDYGDLSELRWDEGLMRQALYLVLDNALRFDPAAQPVQVAVQRSDGAWVIRIQDCGRGVGPEDLARLGTPFFRGANAGNIPGPGFGLALARRIVTLHGGELVFLSPGPVGLIVEFHFAPGAAFWVEPGGQL